MTVNDKIKDFIPSYEEFVVFFILGIILFIVWKYASNQKRNRLKRYLQISVNMPEHQMLDIMKGGYTRCLLSETEAKYEWHLPARSYPVFAVSSIIFGLSKVSFVNSIMLVISLFLTFAYGIKKEELAYVEIYVKDGLVTSVIANNLD